MMKAKKSILSFVVLLACTVITLGQTMQPPVWVQTASYGGPGNSPCNVFHRDLSGNYYFTGDFADSIAFGGFMLQSQGISDVFIAKCDSNADFIWARSFGGTWMEGTNGIVTDAAGHVFLSGGFTSTSISFDAFTLLNAGVQGVHDGMLVKLNPGGSVAWARQIGASDTDIGDDLAIDSQGRLYSTGRYFSNSICIGNDTLLNGGSCDVWLARFDNAGFPVWAQRIWSNGTENAVLATDTSGNLFVAGRFSGDSLSLGPFRLYNAGMAGTTDIFLAQFDSSGNVIWAKGYGGAGNDAANKVEVGPAGRIYISGFFSDTLIMGNDTLISAGAGDVFLAVCNPGGVATWSVGLGGSMNDWGASMDIDSSGNILLVAGYTSPTLMVDTSQFVNGGSYDFIILSLSPAGLVKWVVEGGNSGMDILNGIFSEPDGDICTGGSFSSPGLWLGSNSLFSQGGSDVFFARLSKDVETSRLDWPQSRLKLFPNPACELLTIETGYLSGEYQLVIYDVMGKEWLSRKLAGNPVRIDISGLPRGLYFVRTCFKEFVDIQKVVIE